MTPSKSMLGREFGFWRVLDRSIRRRSTHRNVYWRVICAIDLGGCGFKSDVAGTTLRRGQSKGCATCRRHHRGTMRNAAVSCVRCGALHTRIRYCGVACLKAATLEKNRAWWMKNRERVNAEKRKGA